VQQLHDFARREVDKAGQPAWLVGHSLGGFLSLMCAALHPELARGVLLVDSPLLGGWRATTLGVIKQTQLVGSFSPGAVSRKRRNRWPSRCGRIGALSPQEGLRPMGPPGSGRLCSHGMHAENGEHVLSFDRDVETAIYNTLPDNLDRWCAATPFSARYRSLAAHTRPR
jgi:pimeloyl-ACP methyl ester carboxylesterase